MKKLLTIALSLLSAVCISYTAIAGSLDSPGAPSAGSGMYTLQNLYDYLTSGAQLTVQTSFQEPTYGPTAGTMKTTKEIGDAVATSFAMCDTTAANVESGKKFFCTVSGSWGVQTGTLSALPRPTATPTITPIPTSTPTITPYGVYASCKAILTATPGAGSGTYTIDPDGAGGNPSFSAYCDMTTDGGGWTLVVRIAPDSNHMTSGAYGTLADPGQGASAKLTDVNINLVSTELYRFTCAGYTQFFDEAQRQFDAQNKGIGHAINRYKQLISNEWCNPSEDARFFALSSYPGGCGQGDYNIYGETGNLGCVGNGTSWGQYGTVYAR